MSRNGGMNGSYGAHSSNIFWKRAVREHQQLEENYQAWLSRREKMRRDLIAQIDRLQSSDPERSRSAKTMAKLQDQLEKMTKEDNETTDPELLQNYPHSLTCQRASYRRLAFELALKDSEDRVRRAQEARDAALADAPEAMRSRSMPQEASNDEQGPINDEGDAGPDEAGAAGDPPAAGAAADRHRRGSAQPTFKLGLQIDSFLGRLNSSSNMTRRVPDRSASAMPDSQASDKWQSKWGFHDVRASKFVYKAPVPKSS